MMEVLLCGVVFVATVALMLSLVALYRVREVERVIAAVCQDVSAIESRVATRSRNMTAAERKAIGLGPPGAERLKGTK